jgi:cation:H+ antiporter
MDIFLLIVGLVCLFLGGEAILRGSVAIAQRMRVSTLLVSLVIVGFGTSLPELMVSVTAALGGVPNIALGNVVGSNIANILLILGVAAILAPVRSDGHAVRRDTLVVLVASLLLVTMSFSGGIDRAAGIGMVTALGAYLTYAYLVERRSQRNGEEIIRRVERDISSPGVSLPSAIIYSLGGLVFLAGGAYALVEGATAIAAQLGVSDAIVGLTIVAIGTSLPELATVIVAAYRRHADVVMGSVMGSNLFNALGILGTTAIITPVPIEGRIADIDVWIMLGVAVVLAPMVWRRRSIGRLEGAVFVTLYALYIAWVYSVDFV